MKEFLGTRRFGIFSLWYSPRKLYLFCYIFLIIFFLFNENPMSPSFFSNPSLCGCVFNGFSFFSLTRLLGNICNPRVIPDFPPFFPDFYIGTKMTLYSFTRKFWHLQIYKKTAPECKWRYRFYRIYKKIIVIQ